MGQPEIHRSGNTPLDPDAVPATRPTPPATDRNRGPVPEENRPGHHPDHDQDKPPLDDFAERLGIAHEGEAADGDTSRSADADGDGDGDGGDETPRPDAAEAPVQTGVDPAPGTAKSRKLVLVLGLGGLVALAAMVLRRRRHQRSSRLEALVRELDARTPGLDDLRDHLPEVHLSELHVPEVHLAEVVDRLPDLPDVRARLATLPRRRRERLTLPELVELRALATLPQIPGVPELRNRLLRTG